MKYQKIGVYLSSKDDLPASYTESARALGRLIGETRRTLVYGGARKGLMEVLAQSVKAAGGRVYGVVPEIIERRNLVSNCIDVCFRCEDLNDRKAIMNRESDLLVALPGGIGTLDEVFTVLAATGIGLRRQPVVFLNIDGCWDSLLAALDDLFSRGLITGQPADYYYVVESVEALASLLEEA